ncbi:motility associated factor glycosyltransferase family protein [Clostridium beijerinckii]|uniref:motility associated factor glycosyltransferase family protein n=1 Tax=Clostridium beijerinckii TaxID=1520 RepID=UPI0006862972|nr:6-hydroxymethylpterin diphosphokinase MptE-like protein [Clostridium beijerinckii]
MEHNNNSNDYTVVTSKDGKLILRVNKEEKTVYLGSFYSVSRDINQLISQLGGVKPYDIIIIFGIATGEYLPQLKEGLSKNNKVLIFEPDEKIFSDFLKSKNAKLITLDDKIKLFKFNSDNNSLREILNFEINDYELERIKFGFYANYNVIYREELGTFVEGLKQTISGGYVDRVTNLVHSKTWFNCFLKNVKFMAESTPTNYLENIFKKRPAIIVSAGPSLEKNVHKLKKIQDRFVIITGGRTLRTLLNEGIRPDFLCVVDPVENTYTLVKDFLKSNIPLVFYEGSNPNVVNEHKGKKIYFTGNYFTNEILGKEVKTLAYGGSVAHTCMGLGVHLGCDPIIFMGQDFAFTNEKLHANNATHKEEKNDIEDIEDSIFVDDVFGNKVRTNPTYNEFRIKMESLIQVFSNITYINATEGGANIKGTKVMSLDEVASSIEKNEFSKNIDEYLVKNEDVDLEKIINKFNETLECMMNIKKDCKKAIDLSEKLNDYFEKGNKVDIIKINNKLDKIDDNLNKAFEEFAFVDFLLYPTTQYVLGNDKFLILPDDSDKVAGKKIALRVKALYEGILNVIEEAVPLINKYVFNK